MNLQRELKVGVPIALITLAVVGATFIAKRLGWVDGDAGVRLAMAISGLTLVYFGNRTPKEAPHRSARAQSVRRFSGWVMVLAGLLNAGIWVFAPMEVAPLASMVPVILAVVAIIAYCTYSRTPAQPTA